MSGSGSGTCDRSDAIYGYTTTFTGSNANYSIEVTTGLGLGGSNPTNLVFPGCGSFTGQNTILADTYPPQFYPFEPLSIFVTNLNEPFSSYTGQFQVGNGTGYLDIYGISSSGDVLAATANLVGYVTVESVQNLPNSPFPDVQTTFQITPAASLPEPSTALLAGVFLGLAVWAARSKCAS